MIRLSEAFKPFIMKFNKKYGALALALFLIEVLIALYVKDRIVRPHVGDFLVVILIYCFVRTFYKASYLKVAVGTLLFSYLVEVLQYFKIVEVLGLQTNAVARTVIGTGFDWIDLLTYTAGILTVIWFERLKFTRAKEGYA